MLVAVWLVALVTAEIVALIVGIIGCVTGSLALWKAVTALNKITELELEQGETLDDITYRTKTVEESVRELIPNEGHSEDHSEGNR